MKSSDSLSCGSWGGEKAIMLENWHSVQIHGVNTRDVTSGEES